MSDDYPLDLQRVAYSYLERPNRSVLTLLERNVLRVRPDATILDVGCGCGANARIVRARRPQARIIGIEPNAKAAEAAREVCDRVFHGTLEEWVASGDDVPAVDAVVLSDVLEHVADPVQWLRTMAALPRFANATWIISVPNFGVWYNRLRTLAGRFDYAWSGLYDRTHLRFYTRKSICRLLGYCGFEVLAVRGTASIVQSAAPLLRKGFAAELKSGDHLALTGSWAFRLYQRAVEPAEEMVCNLWPSLLAFQIVIVARRPR
ncbi:MAG TPA: class I SAM-dependent methyltransferase [Thermoanaerobaculia bacterium]|nr:class I SAM-dependent methyltransferase [Thermoanaerobaculia bacterium]